MDIKKLRGFRAVVNSGSIATAAEWMHLSQSAMSRLISSLEDELHLQLFERRNRRVELTVEGSAFFSETERLLAGLDDIPRIVSDIKSAKSRRLRIVALQRVAASLVAPVLAEFSSTHPQQRFSVDIRNRADMERWIGSEYYDIGLCVSLPCEHPQIRSEKLYSSRIMAALPLNHPLASEKQVTAKQLADYPLIGLEQGQPPRRHSDEIFSNAGIDIEYTLETTSSVFAIQMVAKGMGVFITDAPGAANAHDGSYVLVPITPAYELTFAAIYPRSSTPSPMVGEIILEFKHYIQQHFPSDQVWIPGN